MAVSDQLNNVLSNLRTAVPEIKGALIASTDGMVIASNESTGDVNRIAAMVATTLGLGKRICETFGVGSFSETSVAGSDGQVFVYSVGTRGVLSVVAASGANVGLIHIECRDAAKNIATILG